MNMKRILAFFIFSIFISCLFVEASDAQIAKIVEVRGKVLVKETAPRWRKAKVNMYLKREAEIKTEKNSICTLAFDEELKNIITIKEKSHIKLEDIKPGRVFLPQGRVFSLIDDIAKVEKFEIRTPTAIAGVRGTGWSVGFLEGIATVKCYDGNINVTGKDEEGNDTGEEYVQEGSGINVGPAGTIGDLFVLDEDDYDEWYDFKGYTDDVKGDMGEANKYDDLLDDLFDEQKDGYRDDLFEGLHQDEGVGGDIEKRQDGGGKNQESRLRETNLLY